MVTILKKKEPPTLRNSQFFADSIMKTMVFEISKLPEPEVLFIWNVFTVFASEREFLHT
jgi:hypothetical protein